MKESYLYKKISENDVQCQTCAHYCTIGLNKRGKCTVRENSGGKLYALNYGRAIALNIDPLEKKPFFHFLPGTNSLSLATVGCNFTCKNCQNYDISQSFKTLEEIPGQEISPQEIVETALEKELPSISYTYTEPTIFLEYALDTMKIAKKHGIKNTWVTNGFWSKETFELINPYLDAANVDLKSFSNDFYVQNCGGRLDPILENLKALKEKNIWVEVTTLIIPSLSDDPEMLKEIARFIKEELGPETPWHISRFSSLISWKLQNLPDTSVETLNRAYKIGKDAGLKYVYTGNVPTLPTEDTFCPKCGTLSIDRTEYLVRRLDKYGRCPRCGEGLNIVE